MADGRLTNCLRLIRLALRSPRNGRSMESALGKPSVTLIGESLLGRRSGTALGDGWVRSACIICLNRCGILAHVDEDGIVDKILGDPDNPHNHGKTCAKGDAGFEGLQDPDRITTPLRRTNPEKGIGVNPRRAPISWDEALAD